MMRRAVFFDRDGVLNRAIVRNGRPYPPGSVSEVEIIPGMAEGLRKLKDAGFIVIVATNQPDVARGTVKKESVEDINAYLFVHLAIDRFVTCYHDDADNCDCRKPKPGMILASADELRVNVKKSFMVGDRWRDIEAGNAAGCKTIFIDYGYDERQPDRYDFRVSSPFEAIDIILLEGEL